MLMLSSNCKHALHCYISSLEYSALFHSTLHDMIPLETEHPKCSFPTKHHSKSLCIRLLLVMSRRREWWRGRKRGWRLEARGRAVVLGEMLVEGWAVREIQKGRVVSDEEVGEEGEIHTLCNEW
ncbi:hypothetical protein QVD17_18713 [Tagetes erecta]|uniref:Uncharacterized protein n=1 Tax=Tagetes erecta TaxID=13708 RepID=A0AAD8KI85_TARER|nr:hypothetical protein QVD17_18713 [Tagetes erecta]